MELEYKVEKSAPRHIKDTGTKWCVVVYKNGNPITYYHGYKTKREAQEVANEYTALTKRGI